MSGKRSAGVDMNGNPFVGREGIEKRRMLVFDLHLRGMTNGAIAAILKCHRNTVSADLRAIKKTQAKAVQKLDSDEETGATLDYYRKLRDEAYQQYLECESANAKLGFLQAALRAQEMFTKLLMDIGTIEKVAAKVSTTHSGSIGFKLGDKDTDDLRARRGQIMQELGLTRKSGVGRN
jgi:transposase